MKRLALIVALSLMSVMSVGSLAATAAPPPQTGLAIPVVGSGNAGTFAGTFNLTRFVATPTGVAAVGTVTGTLTSPTGVVSSIVQNVRVPIVIGPATCDILHLELGPIHLDLLGLVIDTNRIVLDITAEAGPGNLLGNLLCAVAGLLDNPSPLARLLNQILSILG